MRATSIEAYESIKDIREIHHSIIYATLKKMDYGTASQIAQKCNLDYYQVARRLSEMAGKDMIVDTGRYGLSPTGKRAIIWQVRKA